MCVCVCVCVWGGGGGGGGIAESQTFVAVLKPKNIFVENRRTTTFNPREGRGEGNS